MTFADRIYALVQDLPAEKASEVLTFVETLRSQQLKVSESNEEDTSWKKLLASISGTWKDDEFPDIEEIRLEAVQDIPREIW